MNNNATHKLPQQQRRVGETWWHNTPRNGDLTAALYVHVNLPITATAQRIRDQRTLCGMMPPPPTNKCGAAAA